MAMFISVATVGAQEPRWALDAGIDLGKTFSIVDGKFVPATIPSVTLRFKSFEVSTETYLYGRRFFEQDMHLTWYQRENAARRWSVYASAAHFRWPGGKDTHGQAGLRWRIRP